MPTGRRTINNWLEATGYSVEFAALANRRHPTWALDQRPQRVDHLGNLNEHAIKVGERLLKQATNPPIVPLFTNWNIRGTNQDWPTFEGHRSKIMRKFARGTSRQVVLVLMDIGDPLVHDKFTLWCTQFEGATRSAQLWTSTEVAGVRTSSDHTLQELIRRMQSAPHGATWTTSTG